MLDANVHIGKSIAVFGVDEAARATQYCWTGKGSFDFFPPLTIRNERGQKEALYVIVTTHYPQIGVTQEDTRITFEADNNLDFRVGTGPLR